MRSSLPSSLRHRLSSFILHRSSFLVHPSSFILLLCLLTFAGHFHSPDEEILASVTRAIAERGSLAIEPIEQGFGTRPGNPRRPDGREYAQYGIGQPLLALPFHYLGRALHGLADDAAWNALADRLRTPETIVAPLLPAAERPQPSHERARETARRLALSLFNPLVTALSALVLFRLCRRLTGDRRAAWLAALAWGAGSMAWPHSRTFFTEPLAGLCLLIAFERLTRLFARAAPPQQAGRPHHNGRSAGILPASSSPPPQSSCGAGVPPASRSEASPLCGAGVPPASSSAVALSEPAGAVEAGRMPALRGAPPASSAAPSLATLASRETRLLLAAGAAAAYGCLVRIDSVLFLPALALLVLWGDYRGCGKRCNLMGLLRHPFRSGVPLHRLALFALPPFLAGCLILAINHAQYGQFFGSGYSDQPEGIRFTTPLLAGLYGFLFSVGKGLFFFSPALVLALGGVRPMLRRQPVAGAVVAIAFLGFLCAMSKWQNWAGGWCWGPRHILQIHALLAVPLAFYLAERRGAARRILFAALLAVGAAVQVYGSSQSPFDFYFTFYRDPNPPNAWPMWDGAEAARWQALAVVERDAATGRATMREVRPADALRAPLNDTIYIVQNGQWPGNARLWRERGTHDFFWLHWAESRRTPRR